MDEQQVRVIVKQEIQAAASASRFQIGNIPRHIHNDTDSPLAFQPILTYVGLLGVGSATAPVTVNILPKSWTVRYDGTGEYTVIHNLGSSIIYSCVASAAQSTNAFAPPVISGFANEVSFTWGDISNPGAKIDTGFYFILTVVNNKDTKIPSYYGSYATTGVSPF